MESDLSTLGALTIQRRAEPAPNAKPLNSAPAAQTLIRLQQSHGNAFVQSLIQNQIAAAAPAPAKPPAPGATPLAPVRPMAEAERPAPGRSNQSQGVAKPDEGATARAMTSDLTAVTDQERAVAPSTAQARTAGAPSDERSAVKARPSAAPEAAEAGAETAPAAETPAEKAAAEAPSPATDARFQGVMQRLEKTAQQTKAHKPASKKVAEARAASAPPDNDRSSRAQANQVEVMDQQEAKKPKTDDFLTMLRAEIARIAPKNMEETEKFKKEGKAAQVKGTLTGQVSQRKDAATQNIKGAAEAKTDPDSVPKKEEIPIPKEPSEAPPPDLHAEDTLPQPKSDAEVSVEGNKKKADEVMAENDIDEEQLKKANEPQFDAALDSKKELEAHADKLPETYRQEEQALLKDAKAKVSEDEKDAKGDMKSKREGAKYKVKSRQEEAKKKEEEERKKVADKIQGMYEQTKKKVEDKLTGLDKEVNSIFDSGEKAARERFENYVDRRMADYKWDRYIDRIGGSLLWAKDKLFGMPDEVNRFYEEGRDMYLKDMDAVLVRIAETVETRLKEAKTEIANGKKEIRAYVESLPKDLQKAGQEAEKNISSRFEELQEGVDAKKNDLAQKLAQRYKESRDKLDERIKELQAENRGLVDGFIAKIKEIIEILRNFKERIGGMLRKAGAVIRKIIKDPIGFLGKLIDAVKQGFDQFSKNILTHLKAGLVGWLFGALASAGIEIPSEFSLKAIFGLVLQILGVTKDRIRAKVVKLIGSKNVERIEKAWEWVSKLISEGPAGLWEKIKEYLGNLKEMVMGGIRDWVVTQIVKQAVLWVISLFNPASALLKAIQAIYGVIMFFVERIDQILQLVESVIESVAKIVGGQIGEAATWIEKAMGRTVPLIISFLANLLGLTGVSEKIKSIIGGIQKKVDTAIDKVIGRIVGGLKAFFGKGGKPSAAPGVPPVGEVKYPEKSFTAEKESHNIWVKKVGAKPVLVISSQTTTMTDFLNEAEKGKKIPRDNKAKIPAARAIVAKMNKKIEEIEAMKLKRKGTKGMEAELLSLENDLAKTLREILLDVGIDKFDQKYKLEGLVATYKTSPTQGGDRMTPDHQPAAAVLKHVASLPVFRNRVIQNVATGHADGGVTINLSFNRHIAGRTYGKSAIIEAARQKVNSRVSSARTEDAKRDAAIAVLSEEMTADAGAMEQVAKRSSKDPVWKDIMEIGELKEENKEELVTTVRKQILEGESRLRGQDLTKLKNPL
jgi:hypothetical protein